MATFASVDDLGDALQRSGLPTDAAVLALERASGAIRAHCGWSITQEAVTAQVQRVTRLTRRLWLPTLWLTALSVTEAGVVLVNGTDYAWEANGKVVRSGFWDTTYGGVVATYTHGYPDGDSRLEGVRNVCIAVAARLLQNPQGHSSETTGSEGWVSGVSQVGRSLTDGDKEELGPYTLERL